MKRLFLPALLLVAAACSQPAHTTAELERALPGLNKEQVTALLGAPATVTYSGQVQNWYFTGPLARDASTGQTVRGLRLIVVNGVVREVEF